MATPLLIIVTLIYIYVGAEFAWYGNYASAITFLCYAGANIGLIMAAQPPTFPPPK